MESVRLLSYAIHFNWNGEIKLTASRHWRSWQLQHIQCSMKPEIVLGESQVFFHPFFFLEHFHINVQHIFFEQLKGYFGLGSADYRIWKTVMWTSIVDAKICNLWKQCTDQYSNSLRSLPQKEQKYMDVVFPSHLDSLG